MTSFGPQCDSVPDPKRGIDSDPQRDFVPDPQRDVDSDPQRDFVQTSTGSTRLFYQVVDACGRPVFSS